MTLDLQSLIDQAWNDGGYAGTNDDREPMPHFEPNDAVWIRERIVLGRSQNVQTGA